MRTRYVSLLPFVALMGLAACSCEQAPPENPNPIAAASKPFLSMAVKDKPLKGNIVEISGIGGNIVAIKGKEGTTLLDTGVEPRQDRLDDLLKHLHAKKVVTVIDSHYHFDHTGGNYHYGSQGATIIAQENVLTRLKQPQSIDFFHLTFPAEQPAGLPKVTFRSGYIMQAGGHKLVLTHPPKPAHTDGDSYIKITDANIIFTGDLYFNKLYPFIDYSVGGSVEGMIVALDKIIADADSKTIVVPGHGDVSGKADLVAFRSMLVTVSGHIRQLVDAGKSEDEVVAAKPTAGFDAVWAKGTFNGEAFTRIVYRGMKQ
jgi:cyclase